MILYSRQQQHWRRGPQNALHHAADRGDTTCTVALLSTGSIDMDQVDPTGFTPLMCAAIKGQTSAIRILLNKGANVLIAQDDGATALYYSAELGHLDVTKMLMNAGSALEATCERGCTPLHIAPVKGNTEVARVLVEAGANLNCRMQGGITPLWAAAYEGHKDIVTMLLCAKANPLHADCRERKERKEGRSNLTRDVAAQNGKVDVSSI